MVKNNYYLALDQGGHATRAILFSQTGELVFHTENKISTVEKPGFIVEHNPTDMIDSFQQVLHALSEFIKNKQLTLTAAGLATQRSSFVALNKHSGSPLTPIISWQDRRSHTELDTYKPYADDIYTRTGLVLNPHYGASKMKWCLDHIQQIKQANQNNELQFAPLASYILKEILVEKPFLVDPANASRTLLMNLTARNWDPLLLEIFNIESNCLPVIQPTYMHYGNILVDDKLVPLMICTGDQNAATFSTGLPREDVIYINIGTGAFALNPQPHLSLETKSHLLKSVLWASAEQTLYATEGTVNGAGRALQWFAKKHNVANYESQLGKWLNTFDNPPVFINGIAGVGSPFWIANLESAFEFDAKVEEKFVAICESILFLLQTNIALIQTQNKINKIIISGGLANNDDICQRLSDLSQLPTERPSVTEATARGLVNMISHKQGIDVAMKNNYCKVFSPKINKGLNNRYNQWLMQMQNFVKD